MEKFIIRNKLPVPVFVKFESGSLTLNGKVVDAMKTIFSFTELPSDNNGQDTRKVGSNEELIINMPDDQTHVQLVIDDIEKQVAYGAYEDEKVSIFQLTHLKSGTN